MVKHNLISVVVLCHICCSGAHCLWIFCSYTHSLMHNIVSACLISFIFFPSLFVLDTIIMPACSNLKKLVQWKPKCATRRILKAKSLTFVSQMYYFLVYLLITVLNSLVQSLLALSALHLRACR